MTELVCSGGEESLRACSGLCAGAKSARRACARSPHADRGRRSERVDRNNEERAACTASLGQARAGSGKLVLLPPSRTTPASSPAPVPQAHSYLHSTHVSRARPPARARRGRGRTQHSGTRLLVRRASADPRCAAVCSLARSLSHPIDPPQHPHDAPPRATTHSPVALPPLRLRFRSFGCPPLSPLAPFRHVARAQTYPRAQLVVPRARPALLGSSRRASLSPFARALSDPLPDLRPADASLSRARRLRPPSPRTRSPASRPPSATAQKASSPVRLALPLRLSRPARAAGASSRLGQFWCGMAGAPCGPARAARWGRAAASGAAGRAGQDVRASVDVGELRRSARSTSRSACRSTASGTMSTALSPSKVPRADLALHLRADVHISADGEIRTSL